MRGGKAVRTQNHSEIRKMIATNIYNTLTFRNKTTAMAPHKRLTRLAFRATFCFTIKQHLGDTIRGRRKIIKNKHRQAAWRPGADRHAQAGLTANQICCCKLKATQASGHAGNTWGVRGARGRSEIRLRARDSGSGYKSVSNARDIGRHRSPLI